VHYPFETEQGAIMEAEVTKKLFTVQEYHRMARAGILQEDDRLELIDGEVIEMSPIGHRHFVSVTRASSYFMRSFGDKGIVSVQGPLRLNARTELQPDVVVLSPRADFYASKIPNPSDVLLVVEVSDTTLAMDQKIKLPRSAAAGISEYWIADLKHDVFYIYRNPKAERYVTVQTFGPGSSVSPIAFSEISFSVDDLLSTDCKTPVDER
jgi:Uma2 family endonuclease